MKFYKIFFMFLYKLRKIICKIIFMFMKFLILKVMVFDSDIFYIFVFLDSIGLFCFSDCCLD